ncbi:unnamed protein product [Timema podura]|uniref:Uncharacterized protein n=1 Tax=Timema podura TaxID=61482 RepID=A0ABN7NW76_TIMPD|nr:unnamed protein product [Timema podura]
MEDTDFERKEMGHRGGRSRLWFVPYSHRVFRPRVSMSLTWSGAMSSFWWEFWGLRGKGGLVALTERGGLRQESIFYARGKSRTETRKLGLGELTLDPVGKHSSHTAQKTMRMPSCPPTLDINCGVIKIHYFIEGAYDEAQSQCKATTSGAHMNLYVATPLTVGTVPLIFQQNWEPLSPGQDGPPTVPPTAPPYPDLPPPSYDECVFGAISIREDEDSEHTYGQKQFSPRYPTYNL